MAGSYGIALWAFLPPANEGNASFELPTGLVPPVFRKGTQLDTTPHEGTVHAVKVVMRVVSLWPAVAHSGL